MYTNNNINGLDSFWDDIKEGASALVKTGLTLKQQRDVYKLQRDRAARGLPPLKMDELSPTIKTQIEIGPETRKQIFTEIGDGIKKVVVPLAVGGIILYFMRK